MALLRTLLYISSAANTVASDMSRAGTPGLKDYKRPGAEARKNTLPVLHNEERLPPVEYIYGCVCGLAFRRGHAFKFCICDVSVGICGVFVRSRDVYDA